MVAFFQVSDLDTMDDKQVWGNKRKELNLWWLKARRPSIRMFRLRSVGSTASESQGKDKLPQREV